MVESNDSIPFDDAQKIYLGGKEHHVGSVSVIVYGDQDKPALDTYPDLALNHKCNAVTYHSLCVYSCTLDMCLASKDCSFVQKQLPCCCIYHISPPGHEARCMGVTAGAYILTLFAVQGCGSMVTEEQPHAILLNGIRVV